MKKAHKILICITAVLLLLGLIFIAYFADYHHELPVSYDKTEDISYTVKETGYGWMFDAGSSSAVIFYPGGNHRQFGNYEGQMNDGTPQMTLEQQQTIASNVITSYMKLHTGEGTR